MDNKQTNPNFKQFAPFVPRPPLTINRSSIPEKKISDELINKLHLVVADGNFLKVTEFILANNLSMSPKNVNGESVLHLIIKNTNLTEYDKMQLVKLAIKNGAQVSSYDNNNVLPIHLASKYQLESVAKLLLDNGASAKSVDSQYKTPLHYAVVGENVSCPNISEKKVKPIIPEKIFGQKEKDTLIQDLSNGINNFIFNDGSTRQYISQIETLFKNFKLMYPFEFKIVSENIYQKLNVFLADMTISEDDKKKKIFDELLKMKSLVNEIVQTKIKTGIEPLPISPNNTDGWGPGDIVQNKILPTKTLMHLVDFVDFSIQNEKGEKITKMQSFVGKLGNNIQQFAQFSTELEIVLEHCQYYSAAIGAQIAEPNMTDQTLLTQLFFEETPLDLINFPTIDSPYKLSPSNGRVTDSANNTQLRLPTIRSNNPVNPAKIRMTKGDAERLYQETGARARKVQLTNERPLIVGENPVGIGNVLHLVLLTKNGDANTSGIYFNYKFKFYAMLLSINMRDMNGLVSGIVMTLENSAFGEIYGILIPRLIVKILNVSILLSYLRNELEIIQTRLSAINKMFLTNGARLQEDNLFLLEQIESSLKHRLSEIGKLGGVIENVYQLSKNIYDILNGIISLIEMISAHICINAFYDQDNFYATPATKSINKIIDKPLKKLRDFPNTLTEFNSLLHSDVIEMKKNMIEQFVLQITIVNSPSFIDGNNNYPPRIGFLGIEFYGKIIPDLLINPINGTRKMARIEETGNVPNTIVQSDITLMGYVGQLPEKQYNKNENLPLVIGKFLGDHLMMLKQSITRWLVEKFYNYMVRISNPVNRFEIEVYNILVKLMSRTNEIIPLENGNFGFILALIGKYVDISLNNFIVGLAGVQTNTILIETLKRNENSENYADIMKRILRSDTPALPIPQKTFSLDLNEVFNELFSMQVVNINSLAVGNLTDDAQEKDKDIQIIGNFNYDSNTLEQICFKINPKIVKMLIESGAPINSKDSLGNSAIYYALELKNKDVISLLLERGATVDGKYNKNRFGKSAIDYAWDEYIKVLNQHLLNSKEICELFTKNLLKKFKKKSQYGNNIPRYSDIIFPTLMYILNHQLFLIGKGYPNKWTYEKNKYLENYLVISFDSVLPLINNVNNVVSKTGIHHALLSQTDKQLDIKKNQLNMESEQLRNINKEYNDLENQLATEYVNARLQELEGMMLGLTTSIRNTQGMILALENKTRSINSNKINEDNSLKIFLENNKRRLKMYDTAVQMYESVFINVLNFDTEQFLRNGDYIFLVDIKTYPTLWKNYIKNVQQNDYTQIIEQLSNIQNKISKNDSLSLKEKLDQLAIVNEYLLNVIIPFSKNYFELPKEYNGSNYALTIIMDIIVHIVKRIIFVTMYETILKSITKYMISSFPNNGTVYQTIEQYQNYILNSIIGIIDGETNKSKLMKYIFDVLPLKVVKVILQIYEGINEGETDIDRSTTIDELFMNIVKLLESNTTISFPEEYLAGLKNNIMPYYIDYVGMFVKEMKNLVDAYLRTLQQNTANLEMLILLSQKLV